MGVDVVANDEVGLLALVRELLPKSSAEELAQDGDALSLSRICSIGSGLNTEAGDPSLDKIPQ